MSNAQIEIQLIASLVAIACAIPGTFLVLRKMAMISDAISHSILPGIVIGFFYNARFKFAVTHFTRCINRNNHCSFSGIYSKNRVGKRRYRHWFGVPYFV